MEELCGYHEHGETAAPANVPRNQVFKTSLNPQPRKFSSKKATTLSGLALRTPGTVWSGVTGVVRVAVVDSYAIAN